MTSSSRLLLSPVSVAAQQEKRRLREAASLGQQAELHGGVVEVEEAAGAAHAAALELQVVEAVQDQEAVRGRHRTELPLVRPDRAPRDAGERALAHRLAGRLDA